MKEKTCPKCGKSFYCSHQADCWCTKYILSAESLRFLRGTYPDCLCEDCLKAFSEKDK